METLEILESRGKLSIYLIGSLAFLALCLFVPGRDDGSWRIWGEIVFGLCSLVFALLLTKPRRLILDGTGFTVTGGLTRGPRRVGWHEVESFFVLRQGRGGKHVAYNRRKGEEPLDPFATRRRLARTYGAGADGLVSGMWPGSAKKTVALLSAWHTRAQA